MVHGDCGALVERLLTLLMQLLAMIMALAAAAKTDPSPSADGQFAPGGSLWSSVHGTTNSTS
jgi:hypothetical protein